MAVYYIVSTPKNPEYSGKAFGVQFNAGKAVVSKETVSGYIGLDFHEVARRLHEDFGYDVQKIGEETVAELPVETVTPAQGAEVTEKPKGKGK